MKGRYDNAKRKCTKWDIDKVRHSVEKSCEYKKEVQIRWMTYCDIKTGGIMMFNFIEFTGEETENEFLGKCLKQWEITSESESPDVQKMS